MERRKVRTTITILTLLNSLVLPQALCAQAIQVKINSTVPSFMAVASGTEKLEAGGGKVSLIGHWQSVPLKFVGLKVLPTAFVFDYANQNQYGGNTSKPYSSDNQSSIVEILLDVLVPDGSRVIDISHLILKGPDGRAYEPIGFDVVRSTETSTFFSKPENSLCLVENGPAQYLAVLNAAASSSSIVYFVGGSTRPLPLRLLFQMPSGISSVTIEKKSN